VRRQVAAECVIIEGEAVGYVPETGEHLPFQVTVQRRRKHGIEAMREAVPLRLFAFDLLYADDRDYLSAPLTERRAALEALITTGEEPGNRPPQAPPKLGGLGGAEDQALALSPALVTGDAVELGRFFDEMVSEGLEGIVVKRLDAPYTAGARSYNWIKLKRGYRVELADTVDCVLVGYLYGRGQRARFGIGSLLAAVYDREGDRFPTIAKIGSGLSDEAWVKMKALLDEVATPHRPARVESVLEPDVWCEPRYVVEVQADEITRSPMHPAGRNGEATGYALRFPRMLGWIREDKRPEDATSVEEIVEMFRIQRRRTTPDA
jgi:DNA ligase-1